MKTPIILNNKIALLDQYDYIDISIIVPLGNLEQMKVQTKCKIISKKSINLQFNHHAGSICNVSIKVRFKEIEKFLKFDSTHDCENKQFYYDMLPTKTQNLPFYDINLKSDSVALYAFGKPIIRPSKIKSNGIYISRTGEKINVNNKFNKYIQFKKEWFRLVDAK